MEPRVADRGAQAVHVTRDVRGRHVLGDRAAAARARVVEEVIAGDPRSSSSASIGNANGMKNGSHWRSLPKQRNAALVLIPRGSKPTRS